MIRLALVVSLVGCLRDTRPECLPPRALLELNSAQEDFSPLMSSDRKEIVWVSNRSGRFRAFHAERADASEPFRNIAPATGDMAEDAFDAWVSADRDTLWFIIGTRTNPGYVWAAMRDDTAAGRYQFNSTVAFPELGAILHPTLTADELTLVYSTGGDLYLTARASTNDPFPKGHPLSVSTPSEDRNPTISADGQTLVFDTMSVVSGEWRVMRARRSRDDFVDAVVVDLEDATPAQDDESPWLHPDGQTLLFSSNRDGGIGSHDLWIDCE